MPSLLLNLILTLNPKQDMINNAAPSEGAANLQNLVEMGFIKAGDVAVLEKNETSVGTLKGTKNPFS
jgi:hypothetical protein